MPWHGFNFTAGTAEKRSNVPGKLAVDTVLGHLIFWLFTMRVTKRQSDCAVRLTCGGCVCAENRAGRTAISKACVVLILTLPLLPACRPTAPDPAVALRDAPPPPFTDIRFEAPGVTHKITVQDLPAPYATRSYTNFPNIIARPPNALPKAPSGFQVNLYAENLGTPRVIRMAPNGDIFVAESGAGRIRVFRGLTATGTPERSAIFAGALNRPYGIAFYPPGADPQWIYVGVMDAVLRFAYRNGDLQARGPAQHIAALPTDGRHWTRELRFSADGKTLFVGVGSASNVDDPESSPAETNRADILAFDPDGANQRIYAWGIRNPSGLAIDPATGQLWCVANERDGLGDNLVPDYVTRVREGGFYGWPWWYLGPHQDPHHSGKHPELGSQTIVPDVLLQAHTAPLQLVFYDGEQFPSAYHGDIFLTSHGSWNRSVRTGYEVIRVPRHQSATASGEYEDFLTGFALSDGQVWGRPVGVTTDADGSLLVTDDASNSIWRVRYVGP